MLTLGEVGEVAPYQQIWDYSCGAAALKAVLQHWGEKVDEPTLIAEVGVDPKSGSTAYQVASAAHRRGYLAQIKSFKSIDELGSYTKRDIPVIIAIRSFHRPNQGHFVVATEVTPCCVKIMDPNVQGNRRTLRRDELLARWEFRDRTGVVITSKSKRKQFGEEATTAPKRSRQMAIVAITATIVALAATTAGVVIYRRRQRQ